MSYDITIGNVVGATASEDAGKWTADIDVPVQRGGPAFPFDALTGDTSYRAPGYLQWEAFCTVVGLHAMFYDTRLGIMREHPGVFSLHEGHLAGVRAAITAWRSAHPTGKEPGWDWNPLDTSTSDDGVRDRDSSLARLLWLEFWFERALARAHPVIKNE